MERRSEFTQDVGDAARAFGISGEDLIARLKAAGDGETDACITLRHPSDPTVKPVTVAVRSRWNIGYPWDVRECVAVWDVATACHHIAHQ